MIISRSPETGGITLCVWIWGRLLHVLPHVFPRLNVNPSLTHHVRGQNHYPMPLGMPREANRVFTREGWSERRVVYAASDPSTRRSVSPTHDSASTRVHPWSLLPMHFDRARPYERDPRLGDASITVIARLTYPANPLSLSILSEYFFILKNCVRSK